MAAHLLDAHTSILARIHCAKLAASVSPTSCLQRYLQPQYRRHPVPSPQSRRSRFFSRGVNLFHVDQVRDSGPLLRTASGGNIRLNRCSRPNSDREPFTAKSTPPPRHRYKGYCWDRNDICNFSVLIRCVKSTSLGMRDQPRLGLRPPVTGLAHSASPNWGHSHTCTAASHIGPWILRLGRIMKH